MAFAAAFILSAALLTLAEYPLLTVSEVLSALDPHSSMFTGLAYVIMWFAVAIELAAELVVTSLQLLFAALRSRLREKS